MALFEENPTFPRNGEFLRSEVGLLCLCDVTCEQNPCPVEPSLVSSAVPELPSSYSGRAWWEPGLE